MDSLVSHVPICYTKFDSADGTDLVEVKRQAVVDKQIYGAFVASYLTRINTISDHLQGSPLTQFHNHPKTEKDVDRTKSNKHYLA